MSTPCTLHPAPWRFEKLTLLAGVDMPGSGISHFSPTAIDDRACTCFSCTRFIHQYRHFACMAWVVRTYSVTCLLQCRVLIGMLMTSAENGVDCSQSDYERALDALSTLETRRVRADESNNGDGFDVMYEYLEVWWFIVSCFWVCFFFEYVLGDLYLQYMCW